MSLADFNGDSGSFMNMTAEEILRLFAQQKVPHGSRTGMQALANAVELRFVRRAVADEEQRRKTGKAVQPPCQFRLAIFAGSVEWRRIRIAESRHLIAAPPFVLRG